MKHGYSHNIEQLTLANDDFRHVLYTGEKLQLVLMTLPPGVEIGLETHHENDQFFRVEAGQGRVVINGTTHTISDGISIVVPAGAEHNIINDSVEEPLKLYTIYAPPHHADGTVHHTKGDAEAADEEFHGDTSE